MPTDPTPDALLDEARAKAALLLGTSDHGLTTTSSLLLRLVARIEDLEARLPQQEKAQ